MTYDLDNRLTAATVVDLLTSDILDRWPPKETAAGLFQSWLRHPAKTNWSTRFSGWVPLIDSQYMALPPWCHLCSQPQVTARRKLPRRAPSEDRQVQFGVKFQADLLRGLGNVWSTVNGSFVLYNVIQYVVIRWDQWEYEHCNGSCIGISMGISREMSTCKYWVHHDALFNSDKSSPVRNPGTWMKLMSDAKWWIGVPQTMPKCHGFKWENHFFYVHHLWTHPYKPCSLVIIDDQWLPVEVSQPT